ncbi:MAG: 4-hydroxy-tetrahydrodipicolinate reductase [Alphaproteobacteria bacterium]|nr:4-hydroxy-tetrahydrodipicolinate reductase [Alphaproteobacteria bacterium]
MRIGITGCTGRVGKILIEELSNGSWDGLELSCGHARDTSKVKDPSFTVTDDADELFKHSDAVIDFTLPDALPAHLILAAKHKTALIIGTTGIDEKGEAAIKNAAKDTAIVYAANMSLGVNLLLALVERAAASLNDDWDIEIFESHHKHKIDAPSGTALAIGKAAAEGRNVNLDDVKVTARDGVTGERKKGDIGFSVARGGDVVGEHTAFFYGAGERIELTHMARDRSLFARGALQAAKWCDGKPAGLYSMKDVLGL